MASGASTFGAVPPVDLFLGLTFLPRVSPCWSQGVWAKGGSGNLRRHRGLCVIFLPYINGGIVGGTVSQFERPPDIPPQPIS